MAKPVEVIAVLKDLFSAPAQKVADAAGAIAKQLAPVGQAIKAADTAAGTVAQTFNTAATSVKNFGAGVSGTVQDVSKQLPNMSRAMQGVIATAKTLASVAGSTLSVVGSAASRAVSAVFSLKTAVIGFAAAFVTGRTAGALLDTANELDTLNAASRRTGISVEQLSKLRVAAKLSNIEFTTLSRSLGILNRTLGSNNSGVQDALKDLGIPQSRVQGLKDTSELLPDIADGLAKLNDQQRAAVAQQLFGRGAFEILPLLEGGSAKLREALASVDAFGLTVTQHQAQAADDLTDAVDRVHFAWEKVKASVIEAIGPNAIALLDALTRQLSALPARVANISNIIGVAAGEGQNAQKARALLSTLAREFADLLLDGSVSIGRLIGEAFIGVVSIGITALTPAFERLFRDAIGPVLNVLPGVNIERSKQAQLIELETALKVGGLNQKGLDERKKVLAAEVTRAQQVVASRQRDLDIARGFAGSSPGESDAIQRQAASGRNFSAELDHATKRASELQDALAQLDRVSQLRAETERDTDAIVRDFSKNVVEFIDGLKENGADIGKVIERFVQRAGAIADQAGGLRPETPAAPPAPAKAPGGTGQSLTASQREALHLVNQQIAAEQALAEGRDRAAALTALEAERLKAITDATNEYQGAAGGLLFVLKKLYETKQARINADQDSAEITRELADLQRNYARTVAATDVEVINGTKSQFEATKANREAALVTAAAIDALIQKAEELQKKFPDVQQFKDLAEALKDSKTELSKPPDTRGWGDALFDMHEQTKMFIMSTANLMADGFAAGVTAIVDGTKTIGQAFRDLAVDVLKSVAQMIIKLIALQVIVTVLAAFGVSPELLGLAAGAAKNRGGRVGYNRGGWTRRAGGGYLPGRGPNVDTVPAMLTRGEFVQQRPAVDYYGVGFMNALNQRMIPRGDVAALGTSVGTAAGTGPAYNSGGQAQAQPQQDRVTVVPALVANERTMETLLAEGSNSMLRFLNDNKGKF